MIFKAPFLPYDKIRPIAEQFLKKYNAAMNIPVPIEEIVEFKLKMNIVPYNNLSREYGIDGWLTNDMGSIYVDSWQMMNRENRFRFTIAHEIGHLILHKDLYENTVFTNIDEWIDFLMTIDPDQYSWFEKQGYDFAGLVLVPSEPLLIEYRKAIGKMENEGYHFKNINVDVINQYISNDISKVFCVSSEVAKKRIDFDQLSPLIL